MSFRIENLQSAYLIYNEFMAHNPKKDHERFIFPFFAGSYFSYRMVDVLRVVAIANSISSNPKYVDVGCGYGDFLLRIRQFLPNAIGIEQDGRIFYIFERPKPTYIYSSYEEWNCLGPFDVSFVGWMEPGLDIRKSVSRFTNCVVTTFDSGGQCGVMGGCEYDEFGFQKLAWWRTPSWIDVNCELMNRFYTPSLKTDKNKMDLLAGLRTAHNFWYVYVKPEISDQVRDCLRGWLIKEKEEGIYFKHRFGFESVLDECGFRYMETLNSLLSKGNQLWQVEFD
jgi:hypothetical protein